MRGRLPKPTAVKKLAGNPGKRRLPKNEPQPAARAQSARPKWLNLGARQVWDEYAPRLEKLGMLSELDGDVFGQWCSLAAEFRADPVEMSANRIARMDAMSQRFGMDPSSRTRIAITPKEDGNDESRFFGAG